MSSAPPGWHLQPDGQERFWDGERWTDEFRDPASAPTEAIPIDQTRGIPQGYAGAGSPARPGGQFDDRYDEYYQPGGPLSDRPAGGGTPGWLKGCGVVLVVLLVLSLLAVGVGSWLFSRMSTETPTSEPSQTVETGDAPTDSPAEESPSAEEPPAEPTDPGGWPTELPTEFPTDLPTSFPTDLPTDLPGLPGAGAQAEVSPGESFSLGPAEIQEGWSATRNIVGLRTVSMTVVATEASSLPLVFSLAFLQAGAEVASTICTTQLETVGQETEVACVPMRGEAESADTVRASGGFGG